MATKTKKTKNKRGRPKKEFKDITKKKVNTENKKRGRGRPKKKTSIKKTDSINTRISKHNKDIKKISKDHKKIHVDIKNTTFSNKKIKKTENKGSDKFALGLLIFSMLLFIFSLYKTFYIGHNNIHSSQLSNNTETIQEFGDSISETNNPIKKTLNNTNSNQGNIIVNDNQIIKKPNKENMDYGRQIIENFYSSINNKKYENLSTFLDSYMQNSNVFITYYNDGWLNNFLDNINNGKIYLTDIVKLKSQKENVEYYTYILKYKLKDQNELFRETWKVAIVDRGGDKLIGSLQCTNTGCSKMPFFNPQLHGIK